MPWITMYIKRNGDVFPCCWSKGNLGNILNYPEIEQIRNSYEAIKFRRKMLSGDLASICQLPCPDMNKFLANTYIDFIRATISESDINPSYKNNVELIIGEIDKTHLNSAPLRMSVELSSICNLECIMCGVHLERPIRELPLYITDYILNNISKFNTLILGGGEPLIYKGNLDIIKAIAKFDAKHLTLNVVTNLNYLDEITMGAFREFKGHISLHISLEASNENLYRKIRIGGNWQALTYNLAQLIKLRNENPAKLDLVFCYTMMEINYRDIVNFIRFANDMDIPVHFSPVRGNLNNQSIFLNNEVKSSAVNEIEKAIAYIKQWFPNKKMELFDLEYILGLCKSNVIIK